MVKLFGRTILNSIIDGGVPQEWWEECNKTIRQYIALSKCLRTITHVQTFGSHDTPQSKHLDGLIITIANGVDGKLTQIRNKDNLTPCSWWRQFILWLETHRKLWTLFTSTTIKQTTIDIQQTLHINWWI